MNEMKPCPFCGGSEIRFQPGAIERTEKLWCGNCGACGDYYSDRSLAIENWNRRASIERLEKVNEALVRYAEQVRDCKYVPDYVHEWSEAVLRLAKEPA